MIGEPALEIKWSFQPPTINTYKHALWRDRFLGPSWRLWQSLAVVSFPMHLSLALSFQAKFMDLALPAGWGVSPCLEYGGMGISLDPGEGLCSEVKIFILRLRRGLWVLALDKCILEYYPGRGAVLAEKASINTSFPQMRRVNHT